MTTISDLSHEQLSNARTIIGVGRSLDVPPYGWVIALATALQESGLRNLHFGDRDSQGLFQQRPASGWGTVAQITDPTKATQAFFGRASHTKNRGLLDIAGWQQLPVTEAAQKVQVSAFPDAYAKWETLARALVAQLSEQRTITIGGRPHPDITGAVSARWVNLSRQKHTFSRHTYYVQCWLQDLKFLHSPPDGWFGPCAKQWEELCECY